MRRPESIFLRSATGDGYFRIKLEFFLMQRFFRPFDTQSLRPCPPFRPSRRRLYFEVPRVLLRRTPEFMLVPEPPVVSPHKEKTRLVGGPSRSVKRY
jgi:hypothetical protein